MQQACGDFAESAAARGAQVPASDTSSSNLAVKEYMFSKEPHAPTNRLSITRIGYGELRRKRGGT